MKSTRRYASSLPSRAPSQRPHGRITKEDIRAAGLRRWNGRARVTTDWINVFNEPELCFPTGDVLVYLREPGQSSRGPAFRVHRTQLKAKGFDRILEKCIERAPLPGTKCMHATCPGCERHKPPAELYIPAPAGADLDTVFDHHITTRNFFAWMYDLPLAGRALGRSLVALKDRIDFYRPRTQKKTAHEVVSFAESHRYLDFRECVDHALAALLLAESLKLEDLWIDAFSHCVGLSHQGMDTSFEYPALRLETRTLINKSRMDMELRLDRISKSVGNFFENDLTGNLLGLSQTARDHFDRFRSWLHSYYIEREGFWPPTGFENEANRRMVYSAMYSDFRSLYHHLADPKSTNSLADNVLAGNGGVCTLQNVQAFNTRHHYDALPNSLPILPREPTQDARSKSLQRRQSWNPITKRKIDRDNRNALRMQALITASNRDWNIMECHLVRRYSDFEAQTILDDSETISMIDGRKVRWILVYTILQTLISVMQSPKQVRNTEGLSYSLCCHIPKAMPWQSTAPPRATSDSRKRQSQIEPDMDLLHSNLSSESIRQRPVTSDLGNDRRQTLPSRLNSMSSQTSSTSRSSSLRRFMSRRKSEIPEVPPLPKTSQFCEIYVQGYGNGLNEVNPEPDSPTVPEAISIDKVTPKAVTVCMSGGLQDQSMSEPPSPTDQIPDLTPTSSASVSRESSNASNSSSSWSKASGSTTSASDAPSTPTRPKPTVSLHEMLKTTRITNEVMISPASDDIRPVSKELDEIFDEQGFKQTIHFNTKTWDEFLGNA